MPQSKDLREILGVEVFAVGTWNGDTYTLDDLDAMVVAHEALGSRLNPPLKLGHDDDQKILKSSGLPAAGWIDRVYRIGDKLMADIRGIPQKVFELIEKGAYRKRSAEILWDWQDKESGTTFSRVLCGLALLGGEIPAVSTLDDILELYGGQAHPNLHAYYDDVNLKQKEPVSVQTVVTNHDVSDVDGIQWIKTSDKKADMSFKEKTKSSVGFEEGGGDGGQSCQGCRFFSPDFYNCSLVEGLIRPEDVCDLFEERIAAQDRLFSLDEGEDDKGNNMNDKNKAKTYTEEELNALIEKGAKSAVDTAIEGERKNHEEQRAKDRETYEKDLEVRDEKIKGLEEGRSLDSVTAYVESRSTVGNMKIVPANKDRAIYLLTQMGTSKPKVYVSKDKEGKEVERSLTQTFMDFIDAGEDLTKRGMFTEESHEDGKWRGVEGGETTEGKMKALAAEYKEKHSDLCEGLTEIDIMEVVSKESPENGALFSRYIASGGNA